jgi:hypothetical protein
LNLRSHLQINNKEVNPAFTTARYYFDTKYDYVTVLTGYGSSPDERVSLVDLEQRISLNPIESVQAILNSLKSIYYRSSNYDKSSGIYCK